MSGYIQFQYFGSFVCEKNSFFKKLTLSSTGYSNITCSNTYAGYASNDYEILAIDQDGDQYQLNSKSKYFSRVNVKGLTFQSNYQII